MKNYFVTAIGTDSGKTVISAILVECLEADYWKPIQAGLPRDTDTVLKLVSSPLSKSHPEAYILNTAASPHAAAKIDSVTIDLQEIKIPVTANRLVIEGAGGLMVPLNEDDLIIDLIPQLNAQIILVCDLYLGSINHSLLTIEALRNRDLDVAGIIFNGPENMESESIILKKSGFKHLLTIRPMPEINPEVIRKFALQLRNKLNE